MTTTLHTTRGQGGTTIMASEQAKQLADFYMCLSLPVRIQILRYLLDTGGCTIAKLAPLVCLEYLSVDYHLKLMREAGILARRRTTGARYLYSCINPELIRSLLDIKETVKR